MGYVCVLCSHSVADNNSGKIFENSHQNLYDFKTWCIKWQLLLNNAQYITLKITFYNYISPRHNEICHNYVFFYYGFFCVR